MNKENARTVLETTSYEIVVKRSKFVAYLFHIADEDEAKAILDNAKKKYFKANHRCFAYIVDEENYKASDDKEPAGTAGQPILQALKTARLTRSLLLVVRYFGGIKLGVGGLFRAYVTAARGAIEKANIVNVAFRKIYRLVFPYSYSDEIRRYLKNKRIIIQNERYDELVAFDIAVNDEAILDEINDLTRGKAAIQFIATRVIFLSEEKNENNAY